MSIPGVPSATEVTRAELPITASPTGGQGPSRVRGPWRRPWFLSGLTWAYIVWSLVPVLIAVQFSFNAGRSRSAWQGFSFRWYWQDPVGSVWHDPSMRLALQNSLVLAVVTTIVATPIGVALALGLTRWRGRGAGSSNTLMLLPLATPEIVMGSALFLVFTNAYTMIPLGRPAQILGHVTVSISYVVVIVRGRLLSVGREYEVAAQDLGASPTQALRTVLVPMLLPAIFASSMIVFAGSLDDFVVSSFLSADASSVTVPIKLYSAVRNAPSPALNALATIMLVGTLLALLLAWLVLRRRSQGSALEQLATID
jgi:spermidine/putrescine transport system permease protein